MKQTSELNDKAVLVTGAAKGIGNALARHLDALGYRVFAGVRRQEDADALRAATSDRLMPITLDVTIGDHIENARRMIAAEMGERGLYALINNASHNYVSAFEYTDDAKARALMETKFFGPYRLSHALIPALWSAADYSGGTSKLVNIGSIGSAIGIPWEAFYHASKFALLGLSESISSELHAQGIRVILVMPGGTKTDLLTRSAAGAHEAISGLPPEGDHYRKSLKRLAEMTGHVDRLGVEPDHVARRIARLLRSKNPPLRVLVGTDARLINAVRATLPERLFHRLLRRVFSG